MKHLEKKTLKLASTTKIIIIIIFEKHHSSQIFVHQIHFRYVSCTIDLFWFVQHNSLRSKSHQFIVWPVQFLASWDLATCFRFPPLFPLPAVHSVPIIDWTYWMCVLYFRSPQLCQRPSPYLLLDHCHRRLLVCLPTPPLLTDTGQEDDEGFGVFAESWRCLEEAQ